MRKNEAEGREENYEGPGNEMDLFLSQRLSSHIAHQENTIKAEAYK